MINNFISIVLYFGQSGFKIKLLLLAGVEQIVAEEE
jgi:hypothetical protein